MSLVATFVYPLRRHALAILIIFPISLWISTQSILGLPALLLFLSWTIRYAYSVLECA